MGNREVIQNLRQVRPGYAGLRFVFGAAQRILQSDENIFRAIWLIHLQSADASGEKSFDIAVMSRRNMGKKGKRVGAIVAGEIGLTEGEIRIGPRGLKAGRFLQFAQPWLVFIGQQATYIVLE